ncbi:hypothetical protein RA272_28355, partial [Pseudomonas syringae pv. tagetis]|uniref:hypothetical protein n=1 Tax=Pseudomonas syringae group genomosp. 7 TaxID=251699 RepID=UPI00376F5E68
FVGVVVGWCVFCWGVCGVWLLSCGCGVGFLGLWCGWWCGWVGGLWLWWLVVVVLVLWGFFVVVGGF